MPTLQLKITPPQSTERLGLLARRPSYVVVQEVPAANWGYGGRTQAERKSKTPVL